MKRSAVPLLRRNRNLTNTVYNQIIELILNYEIVPGQRLLFEDLATQLNVSRTPVNNALALLAQEGYLDFVPNQGYSIHKMTLKEVEGLYDIREVLEVGSIGKAIRKMSDAKLQTIEQKKNEYENALDEGVTRRRFILDTEFHLSIVGSAGNETLGRWYRKICRKIFLHFCAEDLTLARINEIIGEHNALFEAIQLRDVEKAKETLRHHFHASKGLMSAHP